jgi:hypothetical protein
MPVKASKKETKKQALKRKLSRKALKPRTISKFHKWRDKQFQSIEDETYRILNLLLASAPPELDDFLKDKLNTLKYLIRRRGTQKIRISFRDLWIDFRLSQKDFEKIIRLLQKSWKKAVEINIEKVKDDSAKLTPPGYFDIYLKAI